MTWRSKRVFVSGGAGVIGLELVSLLSALGAIVMVGDLKGRPRSFSSAIIYRQGDLNQIAQLELAEFAPEVFIHLAATFERSTESYDFWAESFWHNVRLSHHLMSLLKDISSMQRVVFASSYLIYDPSIYQREMPQDKVTPLVESDNVMPRNLTGMAKLSHEIELRFLDQFRSDQLTSVCARIFRGYGKNSRDVISRWIRSLLLGEPIDVFRPEGRFDFIYAADTAEGLLRLAESDAVGVINLGTGTSRRIAEVVEVLRGHFPSMQAKTVSSEILFEASQADMSLYYRCVGWQPGQFPLERAIPEIISYERDRLVSEEKERVLLNILVTSASGKVPLIKAVQQAAKKVHPECRVVAGDVSSEATTAFVADEFWRMPATVDENLESIMLGCKSRHIDIIIPTRDGELLFWARHTKKLNEAGIEVLSSSEGALDICIDKLKFSAFGVQLGLPFIPSSISIDGDINAERYVVKERYGAGSRSIGIDLAYPEAEVHGQLLEHPIYQPYVAGVEVSIDAWLDSSHLVKGVVLRKRDIVRDGESQVTTTFQNEIVEAVAKQALNSLGLRGHVIMQGILSEENSFQIIECNARFGGASTASIAAGLDSFYWSLLERAGADISEYPFYRKLGQIRQVRIPTDIYCVTDDHDI